MLIFYAQYLYSILRVILFGDHMTKTLSVWRITEMKDAFEHLNSVPVQTRREWGILLNDYSFAVEVCNSLLAKLERETKRVKKINQPKGENTL